MDISISYHPITKEQMTQWYFDTFEDMGAAEELDLKIPKEQLKYHTKEELEVFYKDKYKAIMKRSKDLDYDNFNKWHAYFIAIAQGFFEKFYFVQGSSISGIHDMAFHKKYVTPWKEIISKDYLDGLFVNDKLEGAYSGGVYISPEQVKELLNDYKNDDYIKELLNEQFNGKKIDVFLAALEYASKNDQGLLEAAKVIEQSEQVFEEPTCYSNVFNCDVISAAVFTTDLAKHFDEIYKGTGDD